LQDLGFMIVSIKKGNRLVNPTKLNSELRFLTSFKFLACLV